MTPAQHTLLMGAVKSAVSSATGLILGLPLVDYQHFSPTTFGGWEHLGMAIGAVVLVSEARFWNQWANSGEPKA